MACSTSPASRAAMVLSSMPDRRHGLDCGKLADAGGYGSIPQHRDPCHAGRDLFEQLQPFRADRVLEYGKTGGIAARPRHACDQAGAHWIDDADEHDRHRA